MVRWGVVFLICTFYNTNDNVNKINKNLSGSEQTTCDIINMTNIINPSIVVNSQYINKNYVYINDLSRYYFVKDITISNNMIIMQLEIDVLYTYKNEILNSTQYISRCEDYKFTDVKDELIQATEKKIIVTKKISDAFLKRNLKYILTVR